MDFPCPWTVKPHLMHPLYGAFCGKRRAPEVVWSPERLQVFEDTKAALAHPLAKAPLALIMDAYDRAVGAVCDQLGGVGVAAPCFFQLAAQSCGKEIPHI